MGTRMTRHGHDRANQRGFRFIDAELIRMFGTEIPDSRNEVYFLRKKDIVEVLRLLKKNIQRLEKLPGCAVVMSGDNIVTIFHASETAEKQLLRRQS